MSIQSEITRISDAKSTLSTWLTEQNVETEEGANLTSIAETISGLSLGGGITEIYEDFDITTLATGIYNVAEGVVMTTYGGSGTTETITWDYGCLLTVSQFTNSDTGLGEGEQWNWEAFAVHTGGTDVFQYYGFVVKITSYNMSIGLYTKINTNNIVTSDNLKTINGNSLIGSGNITIEGGSSGGSAITELTSPIRLWDLEEGFYKIPSGSTVYYYGATNTTSKILLSGGAILTIVNYNDTTKRFSIFCGSNTEKQFVLGYTTSTGGNCQVYDMSNIKPPTFSSASSVLGYTYNTYQNTSNLNGTSELSPGVYARKVNASTTGIPTGITEVAHIVIETKSAFPSVSATYPNIRQDLYALSLNKHWYRMINYASSSSITYGEWKEVVETSSITELTGTFMLADLTDGVYVIKKDAIVNGQYTIKNDTVAQLVSYGDYKDLFTLEGNNEYTSDNRPINLRYRYNITEATITSVATQDIFDCVKNSQLEPVPITLTGVNSSSSYDCFYFPATNMVWLAMYSTGLTTTASSRTTVATVPEGYRPSRRTALATDELQDATANIKATITSAGEITLLTGVAKSSGDDQYISGWWYVG